MGILASLERNQTVHPIDSSKQESAEEEQTDTIPEQADRFQDEVLLEDAFVSEDNNNLEPEESEQNNSDHQGTFFCMKSNFKLPNKLKDCFKNVVYENEISNTLWGKNEKRRPRRSSGLK